MRVRQGERNICQRQVWRKHRKRLAYGLALVVFMGVLFLKTENVMQGESTHINQVFCIGDSITYGSGLPTELRAEYCYPARLQQLLGTRYEVTNYGVSGRTLMDVPERSYRETGYLDILEQQSPDILLVMLGTNDSRRGVWDAKAYRQQYESLVDELNGLASQPKIYLMIPPKAYPGEEGVIIYSIRDTVIRDEISQILREVAEEKDTGVIDLYAVTENHPEYFKDGVHPNSQGYEVIATEIYRQIKED